MSTKTHELIEVGERPLVARLFNFALVLRAADAMPFDEDEYWERPWKWSREFRLWRAAGSPPSPEPGDATSLTWERFVRSLNHEED